MGVQSHDHNITPFLKDSNPLESDFASSQSSTLALAARPPNVSVSQCSRNAPGLVFMRRVSLPRASAEQYAPWWWCQLGTLHSFSVQRMCGAMQRMDSWTLLSQKQQHPYEGQSLTWWPGCSLKHS